MWCIHKDSNDKGMETMAFVGSLNVILLASVRCSVSRRVVLCRLPSSLALFLQMTFDLCFQHVDGSDINIFNRAVEEAFASNVL